MMAVIEVSLVLFFFQKVRLIRICGIFWEPLLVPILNLSCDVIIKPALVIIVLSQIFIFIWHIILLIF